MTLPDKARRATAPALFRLLSECTLSRAALECCGVAVIVVEANARKPVVTHVNASFAALFGYTADEVIGKDLAALVFAGDADFVPHLAGSARQWDISARAKDGSELPVRVSVSGVRTADGALTHWVFVFADRSELERLRAEVESLKALAASSLPLRLEPSREPAGRAQEPCVEVATANELYPHRHSGRVLQKR
jgi:PAS domain S-box-containing protein